MDLRTHVTENSQFMIASFFPDLISLDCGKINESDASSKFCREFFISLRVFNFAASS